MKKKLFVALLAIYSVFIAGLGFRVTGAFFTDSANSTTNTFAAAATFPTATPSASSIVINEVSSSGSANLEWVELYNASSSTIDVSNWKIQDGTSEIDEFPSGLTAIPAGGFALVVTSPSSVSGIPGGVLTIIVDGDIGSGLNNTGDRVLLMKNDNSTVDQVSFGDNTSIFTLPNPPASQSIARVADGTDTDSASNWTVDSSPTLGTTNN